MNRHRFHEFSNIYPLMSKEDFNALVEDIKINGLKRKILLLNDEILDGRSRYLACLQLNVKPSFEKFIGNDKLAMEFRLSSVGTTSTTSGQKAAIGVELLPAFEEKARIKQKQQGHHGWKGPQARKLNNKKTPKTKRAPQAYSSSQVAKIVGASGRGIVRAKAVSVLNVEVYEGIKLGNISPNMGYNLCKAM